MSNRPQKYFEQEDQGQTGRVPGYSQVLPDILAVSLTLRAEFGTPLKLIRKIQIENQTLQRFRMHADETAVFYKIIFYDLAILKVQYLF